MILRYYEAFGRETVAEIDFCTPPQRAFKTDLLEYNEQHIEVSGNLLTVPTAKNEIVTLRLIFAPGN